MTFGTPTKGLTSSLELMEFNSHAKLFLATMYLCSRDKKMIDRGLNPDVACSAERAYELAIKWLKKPGDSAYFAAGKVRRFSISLGDYLMSFNKSEAGHVVRLSPRSEEHTSELQSLMRISYAVFCLKKKKKLKRKITEVK